jgi:CpeT protein
MIEEFKEFLIGSFNNRTQAFSFPSQYSQISLKHVLLQNGMIYGEQWYTVRKQPPYRQFILEITQGENNLIIVSSYKIKDGEKFLYFKDLENITEDDLEKNEGCDCIFVKIDNSYYGKIVGCDCIVERNGKKSFLFTVSELSQNKYRVIDRGYCPETKKMLWGSEHGMFEFDKQI